MALAVAAASLGLLALAGQASAATVSSNGTTVTFTAASGEENDLNVDYEREDGKDWIVFSEFLVDMTAIAPCEEPPGSFGAVYCPRVANTAISLGDQDDFFTGGPSNDSVQGGTGDDRLFGYGGNDTLNGGDGEDSLDGTQDIAASDGSDSLGGDALIGGPGLDHAGYYGRSSAVTIELDGLANDGASGEGDNVGSDIEELVGGDGPDTLIGDSGPNNLDGGFGNDAVAGDAGDDALDGNSDDDRVFGQAGNDTVMGGLGNDSVDGGPGSDQMLGDRQIGETSGGENPGNDVLFARDGEVDQLFCGYGTDRAIIDNFDVAATTFPDTCETIERTDTDAPKAKITKAPPKKVETAKRKVKAKFKFRANEPASFECKLDRKPWKSCASPYKVKVKAGKHRFRVRGTDSAGNTGGADKHKWKVERER